MVKSVLIYQTTRRRITYDSKLQRLWWFNDHKPTFWITLKWILKKSVWAAWYGLISLRMGTSGGLL